MSDRFRPLVEYFRRCYRADSYDLSISNIEKLPKSRRYFIEGEDLLGSGQLHRIPLVGDVAASLLEQADTYRREKRLLFGLFIVTGRVASAGGFSSQRNICSPLIYVPATLNRDEDIFLEVDTSDVRANLPLLRSLLKPNVDSAVVERFPVPQWPLDSSQVAAMGRWLHQYSELSGLEELGRWPRLLDEGEILRGSGKAGGGLRLATACCVVLADRSRGVRGVLHELAGLVNCASYSRPLRQVLGGGVAECRVSSSTPEMLPGLLNETQKKALHNAAHFGLSLVSGPPGTGKSFTIAAMAIDRMLQGESVLIVSKTPQAIDVVGEKLSEGYGLQAGLVRAGERGFSHSLKAHLDSMLKEGLDSGHRSLSDVRKALLTARKDLVGHERRFERALRIVRRLGSEKTPGWLSRVLGSLYSPLINLSALWERAESIATRRARFEKAATDYLNTYRLDCLETLLARKRGALSLFDQALRSRTSKRQAERFAQLDFDVILKAYPIWLVGLDEVSQVLPFHESLFDLVIFDESTQCDIASALPAIQRAKRAVIVGDGKQLRHVSFLSSVAQEKIWRDCLGELSPQSQYGYRDQSLLDVVSAVIESQAAVTMLDEHYRSAPELISFSNQYFYNDRLKIMQARPSASLQSALEFRPVAGRRSASGRNRLERDEVVREIRAHIDQFAGAPVKPSVGVLSPYREQAEYIDKAVRKSLSAEELAAYSVRVATPYGFQGEERDLMLLSFAIDVESKRAGAYLNRADMFNVAVTRAKRRQVVFHSIDGGELTQDNLFARYLSHNHQAVSAVGTVNYCRFADAVKASLVDHGVNVWVGLTIAGHEIDIVCERAGCLLGIDLIGYPGDFSEYFSINVYQALHRAGISLVPLAYRQWENDREACVARMLSRIDGRVEKGMAPGDPVIE
ncbi:DEAD/DEAH box helicase [Microbulbifer aggregans]|uniref:DEAD/DEAH box helicase n=1 Tax=Microbulbifer aggregans TaxID=1769779 RepID=UPI001CFE7D4D|nr:ATP-binding protein [Microbulbifer aggregans]